MFFILSKILTFLLLPYSQMVIWFLLGLFLKNKIWKKRFLWLGIIYLLFFSNQFIVNEALLAWEVPATPIDSLKHSYDLAIILGGTTEGDRTPKDRIYILKSAERMTHTIQLYRMGIVKKILVTGGNSNLIDKSYNEADNMKKFMELCGIPDSSIIVEDKARNTYENAIYTDSIVKNRFPGSRNLVITSAFHMRRAMACFRKTGLNVDSYSTDFYSKRRKFTPDRLFIPDPAAFSEWQMIIREWMGFIFYKLAGYI